MPVARTWDTWLDPELADAVVRDEPQRFKGLVKAIEADVQLAATDTNPDAWHARVLRWIPILNNFLDVKNENLEVEDLQLLSSSLLQAVLSSSHDLEAQVRFASALTSLVHGRKRDLKLQVEWRPLYRLLRDLVAEPPPKTHGTGLASYRHATLFKLAAKLRRFFGPGAVAEVWGEVRGGILDVGDAASRFEALGWLALLLPTHDVCECDSTLLQDMLGCWMESWASVACNRQWDCLWAGLVCRLAKHDSKGSIDWSPHLSRLFTHAIGLLEVPVGTSSGSSPIHGSRMPRRVLRMFMPLLLHEEALSACTIVHLLKTCPDRPHTASSSAAALANLQHLVCLLEQYYHPSNTGKWSRQLTSLLKHLVKAFGKQLSHQGLAPEPCQAALQPDMQRAFVEVLLKLVARAQFSKDGSMSLTACTALGELAYVCPDAVLPLVVSRFRSALETDTATHQLAAAISSLAYCVRPMLLSGWPGPDAEESGPQMLAEAMMALLPGIDANDESKTAAVLHLYTAVLSSVPYLGEPPEQQGGAAAAQPQPLHLPLYHEEWSEELLGRLLALLENLDTGPGGHRGTDQGSGAEGGAAAGASSFLSKHGGLLGHLLGALLAKLPAPAGATLSARLGAWVVAVSLPSVESEVTTLVVEATSYYPQVMMDSMVMPLIRRIQAELPDLSGGGGAAADAAGGHPPLSFSQEAMLKCRLHVLCDVLVNYPGQQLLPLQPLLTELVDRALLVPLPGVQNAGAFFLTAVCQSTCRHHPWLNGLPGLPPLGPNGVERWVDKEGQGFAPPAWEPPTPAQGAAAEALLQRYLLGGCAELEALCAGAGSAGAGDAFGSHGHRTRVTAALNKIWGALSGFDACLHDFQVPDPEAGAGDGAGALHPVGRRGAWVGGPGVRESVAGSLARACRALSGLHPDVISGVLSSASLLLLNGSLDHGTAMVMQERVRALTALVSEPPVAARAAPAGGPAEPAPRQRRRLPRWLATARLQQACAARASHAAFRGWATLRRPQLLRPADLPAPALELLHEMGALALHRYRRVRHEAAPVIEAVCKRFPFVARIQLANALAAIGDVPAPAWPAAATESQLREHEALLFARLAAAASGGEEGAAAGAAQPPAAAAAAATAAAATAPIGASDADTDCDGRCRGACMLLSISLPLWRIVFRDVRYFCATLQATLASRAYNTTPVQTDIGNLVILMLGRCMLPPSWEQEAAAASALSSMLLPLARPGGVKATWRYTMLANVLALLVMPPVSSQAVLPFMRHLLELISSSEDLGLRQLALAGIYFNASCLVEQGPGPGGPSASGPLVEELRGWLGQDAHLQALVRHLVSDHTQLDAGEENKGKRGNLMSMLQSQAMSRSFEDSMSQVIKLTVDRLDTWPDQDSPEAIQEGLFSVGHARVVQLLSRLAPLQMQGGLQARVRELAVVEKLQASSTSEKADQATCAELVAGLLAAAPAGQLDGASGSAASSAWVLEVLGQAMAGTTLELSESWAVAARYAINRLLEACLPPQATWAGTRSLSSQFTLTAAQAEPVLAALLDLLTKLPGSSSSTGAAAGEAAAAPSAAAAVLPPRVKLLRYLLQALRELGCSGRRPVEELPPAVLTFWSAVYEEAQQLLSTDSLSLRDLAGPLLAHALTHFPLPAQRLATHAAASAVANGAASSAMEVEAGSSAVAPPPRQDLQLEAQAAAIQQTLVQRFAAAVEAVQSLRPSTTASAEADAATAADPGAGEPAPSAVGAEVLSVLGVGLNVAARGLLVVEPSALRGSLLQLLPHLFKLQELAGPVLQKLAAESQLALVLLKYLPLDAGDAGRVVGAIQAAVSSPLWSSRAAGLLFTQYFWFRQCFLLNGEHLQVLKESVLSCLSDSKADVRSISSATLAGMIKGLPAREAQQLRQQVLGQARALLPRPKAAAAAAAAAPEAAADLLKKHAAVLGLKAFLMSSPYDCPAWMPEVLLALVPWAGPRQPAAVRADASLALSEFKRTHEQDSLDALRATMSTDDWDSLQAVTSSASYFA